MDDVSTGQLIGVDFHCCGAVFQTNVVPLFSPFRLACVVHGRCMDDLLRQVSKSKSVCKPSTRPSSVHQSKFWKFLRPKSTQNYLYIIKENLRYYMHVLVLIAEASSYSQKHVYVPGLFNRSTSFQLPVLISRALRAWFRKQTFPPTAKIIQAQA
jgi:hypothetical protein